MNPRQRRATTSTSTTSSSETASDPIIDWVDRLAVTAPRRATLLLGSIG